MSSSSAPPPYTPSGVPLEDTKADAYAIKRRLHRFLIDSIAFLYEVDPIALKGALSNHPLVTEDTSEPCKPTKWSILPPDDRAIILDLANTVALTATKVTKQQLSAITATEFHLIHTHVFIPAQQLGVGPAYAMRLLRLYANHRRIDRHAAGLFLREHRMPWRSWIMESQTELAPRFIADDYLAELVAPNEETRVLLGNAVARLSDKYWTDTSGPKMKRLLYVCSPDMRLKEYVMKRMVAEKV
jgi:hypothetical protein